MTALHTPTMTMVNNPAELPRVLAPMAEDYPATHARLAHYLCDFMRRDGSIEVTVRDLSKRADVPFGATKEYLRVARERGLLHLLGRRDGGQLRYCAYQPLPEPATEPL